MALHAKGLSFREVEVTPGIGQLAVFRLSGQRQVPVLVDGDTVQGGQIQPGAKAKTNVQSLR